MSGFSKSLYFEPQNTPMCSQYLHARGFSDDNADRIINFRLVLFDKTLDAATIRLFTCCCGEDDAAI